MKKLKENFWLMIICLCYFPSVTAQVVPFTSDQWVIDARDKVIEDYQGKPSIYLQGGIAYLKDVAFQNGIIEFDILLEERRSFSGVIFHIEDENNYEEFYLRPHLSGKPDAMQYTPVQNGNSAWQLYHDQGVQGSVDLNDWKIESVGGYNTSYVFPFGHWLHVKLLVSGTEAEVYFNYEEKPTLHINELKRGATTGSVGISSGQAPAYFANFSYTKMDNVTLKSHAPKTPEAAPNLIKEWMISDVLSESDFQNLTQLSAAFLKARKWESLKSEATGITNISSIRTRARDQNTVLAKMEITANKDQLKKLELGFSDRAILYCNGTILYRGDNSYQKQDYRHLGTIGFYNAVYLPLKKGKNEIIIAVSETFGGWGVEGKLENMDDIVIQ